MRPLSRRLQVLGGLLRRIGNFGRMETFEDRLVFQKTGYFLQAFGLYLGYHFSWYLYGPYSPGLTRDGFELLSVFDELPEYRFSSSAAQQRYDALLAFLGNRKSDAKWLEALASVHSLRKLYPNLTKDEILSRVADKQPYFSPGYVEQAWKHLEMAGLS